MGVYLTSTHYNKDFDMGYGSFYRLRTKIANYVPSNPSDGTKSFLNQSDCSGKLTPKLCKELFNDIQYMVDDNEIYGYVYCQRTLTDFKDLLRHCIEHRCNLRWM